MATKKDGKRNSRTRTAEDSLPKNVVDVVVNVEVIVGQEGLRRPVQKQLRLPAHKDKNFQLVY